MNVIRDGADGNDAARMGETTRRRVTGVAEASAKSAFHFDVPGHVAKAGPPWLKFLLEHPTSTADDRVPLMWPFDGWDIAQDRSALVEVCPRLRQHVRAAAHPALHLGIPDDERDAWVIATAIYDADHEGRLTPHGS